MLNRPTPRRIMWSVLGRVLDDGRVEALDLADVVSRAVQATLAAQQQAIGDPQHVYIVNPMTIPPPNVTLPAPVVNVPAANVNVTPAPVTFPSSMAINNLPTTQPVSGTVAVSNFPAVAAQPATVRIAATVDVTGTSAVIAPARTETTRLLLIGNIGPNPIHVAFGGAAASTATLQIPSGMWLPPLATKLEVRAIATFTVLNVLLPSKASVLDLTS